MTIVSQLRTGNTADRVYVHKAITEGKTEGIVSVVEDTTYLYWFGGVDTVSKGVHLAPGPLVHVPINLFLSNGLLYPPSSRFRVSVARFGRPLAPGYIRASSPSVPYFQDPRPPGGSFGRLTARP